MDATPFQSIETAGSDLLICYDYRTLDFDASLCTGYEEISRSGLVDGRLGCHAGAPQREVTHCAKHSHQWHSLPDRR